MTAREQMISDYGMTITVQAGLISDLEEQLDGAQGEIEEMMMTGGQGLLLPLEYGDEGDGKWFILFFLHVVVVGI